MNRLRLVLAFILVALVCGSLPVAARASDLSSTSSITQQAQQAAAAGNTTRALGLYELAITQAAEQTDAASQTDAVAGPLEGQYWRLIGQSGDFPRAFDFFTALASQQKNPSPTLLASEASATGTYIGWLYQNKLAASVAPAALQQMDARARSNYGRALAIDPDNFAALYGYAIYESYSPDGKAHMQQLLAKLNSLRSTHPQYPWQLVDYLEQHGHPQS